MKKSNVFAGLALGAAAALLHAQTTPNPTPAMRPTPGMNSTPGPYATPRPTPAEGGDGNRSATPGRGMTTPPRPHSFSDTFALVNACPQLDDGGESWACSC